MTVLETARPHPSTSRQWWVLTVRIITPTLRNGEVMHLNRRIDHVHGRLLHPA